MNAVVRVMFKTDPIGFFERSFPILLEKNSWKSINQEILISTPRRFGKTIGVCLFVSALLFACPNIDISIYSTCKRISQKLLRNCTRFLAIIHDMMHLPHMEFSKNATDEVELIGVEGKYDRRKLNSYPSKVKYCIRYLGLYWLCICHMLPCACTRRRTRGVHWLCIWYN